MVHAVRVRSNTSLGCESPMTIRRFHPSTCPQDRLGSVGNQFAITMILAWLLSLPLVLLERDELPGLVDLWQTDPSVSFNIIAAGLWFYTYNEVATIVVEKTGPVTQSVLNTAKRGVVIVLVGLALNEQLPPLKLIGGGISVGGVFLYSVIDDLLKPKDTDEGSSAE